MPVRNYRNFITFTVLLALTSSAMAQTNPSVDSSVDPSIGHPIDPRQSKIDVADAHAVGVLLNDIIQQPVTRDLTVRDVVNQTNSLDDLTDALKRAEQIGGPRWLDDQTCQVRLEISGPQVESVLLKIVGKAGQQSPISSDALRASLKSWDHRTFVGIGNSAPLIVNAAMPATQPARVAMPLTPPTWANTIASADGESGKRPGGKLLAARQAEAEALQRLRSQMENLPLNGSTLGALSKSDPAVGDALDRAVQRAKLTKVDYQADGGAAVRVSLDLANLWQELNFSPDAGR